jgi:hypothetical protein
VSTTAVFLDNDDNPAVPAPVATSTPYTIENIKKGAEIFYILFQVVAISTAGVWAYRRFGLRREGVARGAISHHITHRVLTDNTVHIQITVTFSNIGNVLWTIDAKSERNFTSLQLIKPITPEKLADIETQVANGDESDYQWPLLKRWDFRENMEVEPSDTDDITYEFVYDNSIKTILVYSLYEWDSKPVDITTVYDIS